MPCKCVCIRVRVLEGLPAAEHKKKESPQGQRLKHTPEAAAASVPIKGLVLALWSELGAILARVITHTAPQVSVWIIQPRISVNKLLQPATGELK